MKTKTKYPLQNIIITQNDGSLDFLKGRTFFPEKIAKAKEMLKNIPIPTQSK